MRDLTLETCKYIYKNHYKSKYRNIKDMKKRSIWKKNGAEKIIEELFYNGILKDSEKYSHKYDKKYTYIRIDLKKYIRNYNCDFNDELVINILNNIVESPNRSTKRHIEFILNLNSEYSEKEIADKIDFLLDKGVLKYKINKYENIIYKGYDIDFYGLTYYIK